MLASERPFLAVQCGGHPSDFAAHRFCPQQRKIRGTGNLFDLYSKHSQVASPCTLVQFSQAALFYSCQILIADV
jgi:hypothetical protein